VNITATLIAQIITFAVLVWFMKRFLWGPITNLMGERQKRIADGLAAAEKGKHELERADKRAVEVLREAKSKAAEIVAGAEKRAADIVDEAKGAAKTEADHIIKAARAEVDRERNAAREHLRERVIELAVLGAGRVLEAELDAKGHAKILDRVAQEL